MRDFQDECRRLAEAETMFRPDRGTYADREAPAAIRLWSAALIPFLGLGQVCIEAYAVIDRRPLVLCERDQGRAVMSMLFGNNFPLAKTGLNQYKQAERARYKHYIERF